MRAFIAIPLSKDIKNQIAKIQDDLKEADFDLRWVKPENTHLTLKFLGEIEETEIGRIKEAIKKTADNFPKLQSELKEFGFFPNERKPKVFFIATSRQDYLKSIAEALEKNLSNLGFKKEDKFKSHITLARIKTPKNIDFLVENLKKVSLDMPLAIDELVLFKSTLTSSSPIYEIIFRSSLTS
tara:strand:- start:3557 stop:4105 length:549 start_codon:yes stop_codon:yes gene_type:complete